MLAAITYNRCLAVALCARLPIQTTAGFPPIFTKKQRLSLLLLGRIQAIILTPKGSLE